VVVAFLEELLGRKKAPAVPEFGWRFMSPLLFPFFTVSSV